MGHTFSDFEDLWLRPGELRSWGYYPECEVTAEPWSADMIANNSICRFVLIHQLSKYFNLRGLSPDFTTPLCSRKFQNLKLRPKMSCLKIESRGCNIFWKFRNSFNYLWNQFWKNKWSKIANFTVLETLHFEV